MAESVKANDVRINGLTLYRELEQQAEFVQMQIDIWGEVPINAEHRNISLASLSGQLIGIKLAMTLIENSGSAGIQRSLQV